MLALTEFLAIYLHCLTPLCKLFHELYGWFILAVCLFMYSFTVKESESQGDKLSNLLGVLIESGPG